MTKSRVLELDGLRAVACALVLVHHAFGWDQGRMGVDIFFVLSGYLITGILLSQERLDLADFFLRRARRLLPAHWLLLAAVSPLPFIYPSISLIAHTWSLIVEWGFYLLWAPTLILIKNHRYRAAITLSLAIFILVLREPVIYYQSSLADIRFDELLIGAFAAMVPTYRLRFLPTLGIISSLLVPWSSLQTYSLGMPLIALSSSLLVRAPPKFLAAKPLVWLGERSYGIYLFHYPLMKLLIHWNFSSVFTFLLGSVLAIILAAASITYIERPILTFYHRRSPQNA